jgi:hypothetical protein
MLIRGVVGWPLLLEGGRAVLEELLLPAKEGRGLQTQMGSFSTRCRLREDGDLLFGSVVLPLFLLRYAHLIRSRNDVMCAT